MGVGTVFMPLGEVFEAMSRGLIDAYEVSSPRFDWEMGMNEVGKYIYLNPIRAPTEVYQLLVKTSKFEALPDDLKMMFNELGEAETWDYHNKLISGDIEALQNFRDYGNIVGPLPLEIEEEFGRQAKIYIDGQMAKDPTFALIVESQRLFAKNFNDIYGLPSWATYSFQ
jgi:TRAP-type mannitol/chloroaromatic compound transport system substrate-binding protein